MDPADLRRWVADKRAVEAAERDTVGEAWGLPRQAIGSALALVRLFGELHGWPPPEDAVSQREDEDARDRWVRLRLALARR